MKTLNEKELFVKQKLILFFLIWILSFTNTVDHLYAQTTASKKTLIGIVLDESSVPIVGASVLVKGTKNGTVTDLDGKFGIEVPADGEIMVSYLGYRTETVVVRNQTRITVVLSENVESIDEVVVIGYGSVRRGDLTGAVSSVNVENMTKAPVASFDQALAGRISGVQVTSADGQPGRTSDIVIRGASSLTQNVSPIYVVDGFVLEDFDPSSISPQDIESINVLKDASSTAIYGAKGANGVIVVTTKNAKIGKPTISYNASIGLNRATKRMEVMNAYEFMKFTTERFPDVARSVFYPEVEAGGTMDPEKYRNAPSIDWQDEILRTGFTHIHNLSINGGSQGTKYLVSLSHFDQEGSVINTNYNKTSGRIALDQTINKNLTLKLSTYYIRDHASGIVPTDASVNSQASSALFFSAYGYRPVVSLDPQANEDFLNSLVDDELNGLSDYRLNPRIMAENEVKNNINTMFIPSANLTYKINNHFTLLIRGGLDRRLRENNYFYNSKTRLGMSRPGIINAGVQGGVSFYQYNLASNENILSYNNTFAKIHKIDTQLGMSLQSINTSSHALKYQGIPYEELGLSGMDKGVPVPQNSYLSSSRTQSFFARVNYNLLSRYLFTVTGRADGSSKFSPENRWGYFPSAAFAWRMSGEPLLKNLDFLHDAKFRVSYGITGNNRVGDFDYYASIDTPYRGYYSFNNGTPQMGASRSSLGNVDLKWESTAQTNIGYDLSLFSNKISFTVDWYKKVTTDLLLKAKLPSVLGFEEAYKNIGAIQNQGWEFSLSTVNLHTKDFTWNTDFNISFNRNQILSLNGEQDYMESFASWDSNFNSTPLYRAIVGQPVSQFWGIQWDGVYQYSDFDATENLDGTTTYALKPTVTANGNPRVKIKPGDIKYKDQNEDLNITSDDRVVIGNPLPKHIGGLGNDFRYKNFSLNVFFQWSYGADVFNANRIYFEGGYNVRPLQNQFASYVNRWTPENQTNEMFRSGVGGSESGAGPNGVYSSMHIEDGSYLRLKTVSFDYNLPSKLLEKIDIKALSLGVAAQNIYTWTAYSGLDPEVSVRHSILTPNFDYSAYPRSLSVVFNLKLTL